MNPRGISLVFLGAWLFFSPFALGHMTPLEAANDFLAGAFACVVAWSNIVRPRPWKEWILCFVGVFMQFAPLLVWTKNPAVYSNDMLVGVGLILFSVALRTGPTAFRQSVPAGWSYNPSTWPHRTPIIALGFLTFFVARMMASYQLNHVDRVWEPFFGGGTVKVLTSNVAEAFPISDAGLGASSYLLEALAGMIGDVRRWRTMPWIVFLFFVLVVPTGVVSIILIMLQPVVVGAWCTLCLMTATLTLITLPPAIDEVFAAAQFLLTERQRGRSLRKAFWIGDRSDHPGDSDPPSQPHSALLYLREAVGGIGFTWNLFLSLVVGLLIVLAPGFFKLSHTAASVAYVCGAAAVTSAVLATAEPTRALRFINVVIGVVLMAAMLILGAPPFAMAVAAAAGLALIGLSVPKGHVKERYGIFHRFIV